MRVNRGFTLVEVLVAVAVFSLSAVSLTFALSQGIQNQHALEQRQLAQWIGQNKAYFSRMQAQAGSLLRDQTEKSSYGGRSWVVETKVVVQPRTETRGPLQQIRIAVFDADKPNTALFSILTVVGGAL